MNLQFQNAERRESKPKDAPSQNSLPPKFGPSCSGINIDHHRTPAIVEPRVQMYRPWSRPFNACTDGPCTSVGERSHWSGQEAPASGCPAAISVLQREQLGKAQSPIIPSSMTPMERFTCEPTVCQPYNNVFSYMPPIALRPSYPDSAAGYMPSFSTGGICGSYTSATVVGEIPKEQGSNDGGVL